MIISQIFEFLTGGINAFNFVSDLRLCSVPTLVTGDVERIAAELMQEENETLSDGVGRDLKLVAAASGDDHCCPPVVDSSTWL